MVNDREESQALFEELLGSRNVYYQPPENLQMKYDAIRYSLKNISTTNADNVKYLKKRCYEVIVISRKPDPEIVGKILDLEYCTLDRTYKWDNLYHYVFTLYH